MKRRFALVLILTAVALSACSTAELTSPEAAALGSEGLERIQQQIATRYVR